MLVWIRILRCQVSIMYKIVFKSRFQTCVSDKAVSIIWKRSVCQHRGQTGRKKNENKQTNKKPPTKKVAAAQPHPSHASNHAFLVDYWKCGFAWILVTMRSWILEKVFCRFSVELNGKMTNLPVIFPEHRWVETTKFRFWRYRILTQLLCSVLVSEKLSELWSCYSNVLDCIFCVTCAWRNTAPWVIWTQGWILTYLPCAYVCALPSPAKPVSWIF